MTIIVNGERRIFDVKEVEVKKTDIRRKLSKLEAKRQSLFALFDEEGFAQQKLILKEDASIKAKKAELKRQLRDLSVIKI